MRVVFVIVLGLCLLCGGCIPYCVGVVFVVWVLCLLLCVSCVC